VAGENLESPGLQGVAYQQGGGLVVFHMAGGAAAAQHVVIHAGHVVVDQGIDVDHFHGTGHAVQGLVAGAGELAGGEGQQGAYPFAAAQGAVAHGVVQAPGNGFGPRQIAAQGGLGTGLDLGHPVGEGRRCTCVGGGGHGHRKVKVGQEGCAGPE